MDDELNLGVRDVWGGEMPFGISAAERRHHVYVVRKTGSGKSTLLKNIIAQDLAAGRGIGLLDPHGDLAEEILDLVPSRRSREVTYFDPADRDFPAGLNLLHGHEPEDRPLVASGIVGAFKGIWRAQSQPSPSSAHVR